MHTCTKIVASLRQMKRIAKPNRKTEVCAVATSATKEEGRDGPAIGETEKTTAIDETVKSQAGGESTLMNDGEGQLPLSGPYQNIATTTTLTGVLLQSWEESPGIEIELESLLLDRGGCLLQR